MKKLILPVLSLALVAAACSGSDKASETTLAPTTLPPTTTTTIVEFVGDPQRGHDIWENGGGVILTSGCKYCHSIDGSEQTDNVTVLAPSWLGMSQRAADRVPGQSAEEYLRESIMNPGAFIVEGYEDRMHSYRYELNDEDLESLVAFLLSL